MSGANGVMEIFVGLLLAVTVLALLARRLHIPYPVFFVIGGLGLGLIPGLPVVRLSPEWVFLFFLPPLLFPAAMFTSWRDFRDNLRPITLLAVGLVLFTTAAVAVFAHYFMKLPLSAGFVLGAIVSPPDAIAATAIATRLKIPRRLVTILSGESLVNDATALVAYQFALAALVPGTFSLLAASWKFCVMSIGGVLLGLAAGWLAEQFHRRVDDPPIEITFSLLTPFVAYLLAERLQVSGVLAVVTAGLYLGWRSLEFISFRTRLRSGAAWEMAGFLLNGFVFILIGLQLPEVLRALATEAMPIRQLVWYALLISLALIVFRLVFVLALVNLPLRLLKPDRMDLRLKWREATFIGWTGMRGVVSLAAAMAVPLTLANGQPVPGRNLILFLTFIVIVVTLVGQGLTLPLVIRWLGLKEDGEAEKEEASARLQINQAALNWLHKNAPAPPTEASQRLCHEYEEQVRELAEVKTAAPAPLRRRFSAEYERLAHAALQAERRALIRLRDQGHVSNDILHRIEMDIDLAETRLGR